MGYTRMSFLIALVCVVLLSGCSSSPQGGGGNAATVPEGSFVFKGKVVALHTSMTDEENIDNCGIVEVVDVLDAPTSLRHFQNQQVTVRFRDMQAITEGEELVLFTEPYWYGESLGVREMGLYAKGGTLFESSRLRGAIAQEHARVGENELRRVLKASSVVVTGKVVRTSEINLPDQGLTEHDPEWKEAEIAIDEVLKGDVSGKTMKIVFAGGKDIMYYRSPKLGVGDDGIFMIQTADSSTARILQNERVLIDPSGFVKGRESLGKIKRLLK